MPKYRMTFGRDRSEYAEVEIEANDPSTAVGLALRKAEERNGALVWTIDQESIIGDVYLATSPEIVPEDDDPR